MTTKPLTRCPCCDGSGWVTGAPERGYTFPDIVYETVRPCQECAHIAYDRWRSHWSHEARIHRHRADEPVYEVHPDTASATVHDLRGFLAETDPALTKDPDHAA